MLPARERSLSLPVPPCPSLPCPFGTPGTRAQPWPEPAVSYGARSGSVLEPRQGNGRGCGQRGLSHIFILGRVLCKHSSGDSHCNAQGMGALPSPHTVISGGPTSARSFPVLSQLPSHARCLHPGVRGALETFLSRVSHGSFCPWAATAAAKIPEHSWSIPGISLEHPRSIPGAPLEHPRSTPRSTLQSAPTPSLSTLEHP